MFELDGLECDQSLAQDVMVAAPGYGARSFGADDSGEEFALFPEATVAGRVVDEEGRSLKDVTVVAEQFLGTGYGDDGRLVRRTRSSAQGTFSVEGLLAVEKVTTQGGPSLPAGSFAPGPDCALTFRKPGRETVVAKIALSLGPDEYHYELDEIVLGPGLEIHGRVVDAIDGRPVAAARVFVCTTGKTRQGQQDARIGGYREDND